MPSEPTPLTSYNRRNYEIIKSNTESANNLSIYLFTYISIYAIYYIINIIVHYIINKLHVYLSFFLCPFFYVFKFLHASASVFLTEFSKQSSVRLKRRLSINLKFLLEDFTFCIWGNLLSL